MLRLKATPTISRLRCFHTAWADTGYSGLSVPFCISKALTGIFPYDSCTRLPSKLTSTVAKTRNVRFDSRFWLSGIPSFFMSLQLVHWLLWGAFSCQWWLYGLNVLATGPSRQFRGKTWDSILIWGTKNLLRALKCCHFSFLFRLVLLPHMFLVFADLWFF